MRGEAGDPRRGKALDRKSKLRSGKTIDWLYRHARIETGVRDGDVWFRCLRVWT